MYVCNNAILYLRINGSIMHARMHAYAYLDVCMQHYARPWERVDDSGGGGGQKTFIWNLSLLYSKQCNIVYHYSKIK